MRSTWRSRCIVGAIVIAAGGSVAADAASEPQVPEPRLRVLVDAFQKHMDDVDGALINGAGLTFSSVSLHDVIKAMPFPVIEVHISNLGTRDEIHQHSVLTSAVRGAVMGLGWRSYSAALRALTEIVREEKAARRPGGRRP